MTVTVVIMKLFILLFLIIGMFLLVRAVKAFDPFGKIFDKMDELDRERLLNTGSQKKTFFEKCLDKLDEHLTQAGVKRFLPKAGVEVYFLFNILEFNSFVPCL